MADVIDFGENFGKKPKKKKPTMSNTAIAKVVGGASKVGISRVQGNQGVTQGNQGWKSQYMPQDNNQMQRNTILNSLTKKSDYVMPEVKHSLLTQKGFNEALGVVGARNNAKLDMQKRRVLGGVFGSLLSSDTQKYAADKRYDIANLDAQTRRYQIDKNYDVNSKRAEATDRYYQGTLQNQKDRLELDRQKMQQPKQKATTPLDEAIKRRKLIDNPEDFLKGVYGPDIYEEMDSEQKAEAISSFIANGTLPKYTFHPKWYNDTINRESGYIDPFGLAKGQNNHQQPSTPKAPAGITGKMLDSISKELNIDRGDLKISDDGSSVILPDGSAIGKDELAKIVGA